jgi:hypothetical protein
VNTAPHQEPERVAKSAPGGVVSKARQRPHQIQEHDLGRIVGPQGPSPSRRE